MELIRNQRLRLCMAQGLYCVAAFALIGAAQAQEGGQHTPSPDAAKPRWLDKPKKGMRVDALIQIAAGWTDRESAPEGGRPALSAHRTRVWFRGRAHKRVRYVLHLAADRVGVDQFALLQGKPLGSSRLPTVLDAMVQVDLLKKGRLRVTGGLLRPAVGRENNSAVPVQPTHELALTGVLARAASVGVGHGRAAGVNVGGQVALGPLTAIYQAGVFAPTSKGSTAGGVDYSDSLGGQVSPLLAGSLTIGAGYLDHMRAGGLLFISNPWRRGRSWMLGVSGSGQGETDALRSSQVFTVFGAARWGGLHLDAEWVSATRVTRGLQPDNGDGVEAQNTALHARLGYNIAAGDTLITPFAMYTSLAGADLETAGWAIHGGALNLFAGEGELIDVGVNWHLRAHRLRVGAHLIRASTGKVSDASALKQPVRPGVSGLITMQASF